jgi:glutaredoxin 3
VKKEIIFNDKHMAVTVYSTPTCPFCHKAKEYLSEKNIEFTDKNVAEDEAARDEMVTKSSQMSVPVLDVNGTIIVGFDPGKIDEALG